jgi:hypothetical protein
VSIHSHIFGRHLEQHFSPSFLDTHSFLTFIQLWSHSFDSSVTRTPTIIRWGILRGPDHYHYLITFTSPAAINPPYHQNLLRIPPTVIRCVTRLRPAALLRHFICKSAFRSLHPLSQIKPDMSLARGQTIGLCRHLFNASYLSTYKVTLAIRI